MAALPVAAIAAVSAAGSLPRPAARGPRRRLDKRLLAPLVDEAPGTSNTGTLILAGGCFWGAQGVFQHVRGITGAVSGYDGGAANKEVLAKLPPAVQRERPRGTNRGLARAFRCATDGAW